MIQASKEAYETLMNVIEQLDVVRPQVLVEALILEVDVSDGLELGFAMGFQFINGNQDYLVQTGSAVGLGRQRTGSGPRACRTCSTEAAERRRALQRHSPRRRRQPHRQRHRSTGVINAAATDSTSNIVSAPHILTSDNEEAEIKIGDNIPIITGRTSTPPATWPASPRRSTSSARTSASPCA